MQHETKIHTRLSAPPPAQALLAFSALQLAALEKRACEARAWEAWEAWEAPLVGMPGALVAREALQPPGALVAREGTKDRAGGLATGPESAMEGLESPSLPLQAKQWPNEEPSSEAVPTRHEGTCGCTT